MVYSTVKLFVANKLIRMYGMYTSWIENGVLLCKLLQILAD